MSLTSYFITSLHSKMDMYRGTCIFLLIPVGSWHTWILWFFLVTSFTRCAGRKCSEDTLFRFWRSRARLEVLGYLRSRMQIDELSNFAIFQETSDLILPGSPLTASARRAICLGHLAGTFPPGYINHRFAPAIYPSLLPLSKTENTLRKTIEFNGERPH